MVDNEISAAPRSAHSSGPAPTWSGIGFRLGQRRLAIAVDEMNEVFNFSKHPRPSPVPGAPSWFRGVSSLRGALLPIVDLNAYWGGEPAHITRRSAVLVVKHPYVRAGVIADELLGLRHFTPDDAMPVADTGDGPAQALLHTAFRHGEETWGVLAVTRLLEEPDILSMVSL